MKAVDMRKKTPEQLRQHASKLSDEIAELKLSVTTKNEKNIRKSRTLRREKARALTLATELETNESEEK